MEFRGIFLLCSYVRHEIYKWSRPNSLGSVSKVDMVPLVAEVAEDINGNDDSDCWLLFGSISCIC